MCMFIIKLVLNLTRFVCNDMYVINEQNFSWQLMVKGHNMHLGCDVCSLSKIIILLCGLTYVTVNCQNVKYK
jgi:hypothetical protein